MIKENLEGVEKRIQAACDRAGRSRSEVTPQELRDKYEILPKNLRWHMIGNLQRNKVKYIIDKAVMIHSLGSLELAETIEKEAEKHQLVMPVLVEVNVAGEASKGGIRPEDAEAFVREACIQVAPKFSG